MSRRLECVGYLFLLIAGLGLAKNVIAPRPSDVVRDASRPLSANSDKRLPATDLACHATVTHNDLGRAIVSIQVLLTTCQGVRVRFADGVTREYR